MVERLSISQAYFNNILQKPMWDDDDFLTYFEGHFEMWELLVTSLRHTWIQARWLRFRPSPPAVRRRRTAFLDPFWGIDLSEKPLKPAIRVRLRTVEERLGHALERVKAPCSLLFASILFRMPMKPPPWWSRQGPGRPSTSHF